MISPKSIYLDYVNDNIDKSSAIDLLMFLAENSDIINTRIESIKAIIQIGFKNEKIFHLLENLLISDSNENIKIIAANGIKNLFLERALPSMKYSLQHEHSLNILDVIIKIIGEVGTQESKEILIEELKKVQNQKCQKNLTHYLNKKKINEISGNKLASFQISH